MSQVRVRFAPSPTGLLHIGGARTALFNWIYAKHTGGTFLLRIEDTDAARNTKEAVDIIFRGLRWFGLDWDEGPMEDGTSKGKNGPYFQSQRSAIYERYIQQLLSSGHAYEFEGAIKFKIPKTPGVVPDLVCGDVHFDRTQEPDLVIARKDGSPVFHLVNVVDDLEMNVTHVIRGEEHLGNALKHLALFEALGAKPPQYAHIPLILNPNGSKMSKRDQGASVGDYIDQGYLPAAVRNYLCLLGWSPKNNKEIFGMDEVIEKFDLPQINRGNAHFDCNKLFWMNGEYMRAAKLEELEPLALEQLKKAGVLPDSYDQAYFRAALAIVKEKVKLGRDLPDWMSCFFHEDFDYEPEAAKEIFAPEGMRHVKLLLEDLSKTTAFEASALEARFKALATANNEKTGPFVHAARLAVSGRPVGPSLYHLLEVLGPERVQKRLTRVLERFDRKP